MRVGKNLRPYLDKARDSALLAVGLGIYLWYADSPPHGYKLAANYCQHYDSRYGNDLNGPSRTKILEIVRYMFRVEALEESSK